MKEADSKRKNDNNDSADILVDLTMLYTLTQKCSCADNILSFFFRYSFISFDII